MYTKYLRKKVRELRGQGKMYSEIEKTVGVKIPKSTFSGWCRDINLSVSNRKRFSDLNRVHLERARELALDQKRRERIIYFENIDSRCKKLLDSYDKKNSSFKEIVLAVLYLTEGSKSSGAIMFGNSDPDIIRMFVKLLRECYKIDESKFRCTVQCRADQNIEELERFWTATTLIPPAQFYKARIDKRTIGQKSRKLNYKGVCRIDYFSTSIADHLKSLGKLLKISA